MFMFELTLLKENKDGNDFEEIKSQISSKELMGSEITGIEVLQFPGYKFESIDSIDLKLKDGRTIQISPWSDEIKLHQAVDE
jgi:hypothetical protein